jgi:hypothetical protein
VGADLRRVHARAPAMPQPTVLDDTDLDYDEGPIEGELVD